jgi:hypothetical protein
MEQVFWILVKRRQSTIPTDKAAMYANSLVNFEGGRVAESSCSHSDVMPTLRQFVRKRLDMALNPANVRRIKV